MNTSILLKNIGTSTFTRQDIYESARLLQSDFKETQLRNLMAHLLDSNCIMRVGRNQYQKVTAEIRTEYKNNFSQDATEIIRELNTQFPYVTYCVWELNWLNEFLDHLVAQNRIFIEVDNAGCEYIYNSLSVLYPGRILLRPSDKELTYYGRDNSIIIDRLISEAPHGSATSNMVPIEKMIVDLFANKKLQTMISKGDYPVMLERIFAKYRVDQIKMFRYARRRNKHKELAYYIRENTGVELLVEV